MHHRAEKPLVVNYTRFIASSIFLAGDMMVTESPQDVAAAAAAATAAAAAAAAATSLSPRQLMNGPGHLLHLLFSSLCTLTQDGSHTHYILHTSKLKYTRTQTHTL